MSTRSPSDYRTHEPAAFDELRDIFGAEKLVGLLDSLAEEIDRRLIPLADDPAQLARDAHVIVSVGGALGFEALSHACGELEAACLDHGDMTRPRVDVAAAAAQARAAIDTLRKQFA